MSNWNQIETAPKDKSILLAFKLNLDGEETMEVKISYWSDSEKGWDGLAGLIRQGKATPIAWLPMPTLPSETQFLRRQNFKMHQKIKELEKYGDEMADWINTKTANEHAWLKADLWKQARGLWETK